MSFLLHSLVHRQAEKQPNKIALRHRKRELSYRELEASCTRFASGCAHAKLGKSTRVGIFLPKTIETVVAYFGTLVAGNCLVPINPILKPNQVQHILND